MDLKGYKRVKKVDIKGWLLRGNAVIYAFILIVFIAAIIFMFNTVGSMFTEKSDDNIENITDESVSYVADNQSYKISINKTENFVTIYKMESDGSFNNPYKTFRCSVSSDVHTGETKINEKYVWRRLSDNVYGHYTTGLANQAYIHSVPYHSQSNADLIASAYNNLGNEAKLGYIYLAVADAKWIYENCGINSVVDIYEQKGEQPLIALNEFSKIPEDSKYDPTDNVRASTDGKVDTKIDYMTGVDNCTVHVGEAFDRWAGIYAVDMNRKDITSYITITGELDLSTPGTYVLIYHLEDNYGTNLAYWRYITVIDGTENETTDNQETQQESTQQTSAVQNETTQAVQTQPVTQAVQPTTQSMENTQQTVTRPEVNTTAPVVTQPVQTTTASGNIITQSAGITN